MNIQKFRQDGIIVDEPMLPDHVDAIVAHLIQGTVYRHHLANPNVATNSYDNAIQAGWTVFAHSTIDIVTAPYWLEKALSYYDAAQELFGRPPRLYSLNAFWTFPTSTKYSDTQDWHRDGADGHDQFTIFAFGTDVDEASRHEYVRGSRWESYPSLEPNRETPPPDKIQRVYGPRGTTVVEDTQGLHRASETLTIPRLLLWARWTPLSGPPLSYTGNRMAPCPRDLLGSRYPTDPDIQRAIQLVVA